MCGNPEYLEIYKGDDSDFALNQQLCVKIKTEHSLSGCTAYVQFYDYIQTYSPIPEDGNLMLVFPGSVTKNFPLGRGRAKIWLKDANGKKRTIADDLQILVTKSIDCVSKKDISFTIAINYEDLFNLPKINGVTLKGNLTAAELGLATRGELADERCRATIRENELEVLIKNSSSQFRGAFNNWESVPEDVAGYLDGNVRKNDYIVILDSSDYPEAKLKGTWRFGFSGEWETLGKSGWVSQYQISPEVKSIEYVEKDDRRVYGDGTVWCKTGYVKIGGKIIYLARRDDGVWVGEGELDGSSGSESSGEGSVVIELEYHQNVGVWTIEYEKDGVHYTGCSDELDPEILSFVISAYSGTGKALVGEVVLEWVKLGLVALVGHTHDATDINNLSETIFKILPAVALKETEHEGVYRIDAGAANPWDAKQDKLVSGENIKTINGETLLGDGNIEIEGGLFTPGDNVIRDESGAISTYGHSFKGSFATLADVPETEDGYTEDVYGARTPKANDFIIVENYSEEESDDSDSSEQSGSTWRFVYTGKWAESGKSGWVPQYKCGSSETSADVQELYAIVAAQSKALASQLNMIQNLSKYPKTIVQEGKAYEFSVYDDGDGDTGFIVRPL